MQINNGTITDPRGTPHGETERGPRAHEERQRFRVTVRERHMGQMLPDAKLYASGTWEIEIFKRDLPQLMELLETAEEEIPAARRQYERLRDEFIATTRKSEREFPNSMEQCFRQLVRRDLLPLTEVTPLGDVESIRAAATRLQTQQINDAQPSQGNLAREIILALKEAGMIAVPAPKASKP